MSGSETVDGRDLSIDGAKLDGIESGADVTDTANVTTAGALMDSEVTNLEDVKAFDPADYATAAQGTLADSATQPGDALSSLDTTVTGSELNDIKTKLDGIESSATADQTGAEIKSAYESEDDTNAFTDADHTKLDGIEDSADVTDTANVVAALTAGTNITIAGDGTITATTPSLSSEEVEDIVGVIVPSPAMVILVPAVSAATTLAVSVTSAESSMPSNLV
jgi:hypothetical protein